MLGLLVRLDILAFGEFEIVSLFREGVPLRAAKAMVS